jgi:hypothetical protein
VRLALKVAMQNDGNFVGVILLYVRGCWFISAITCSINYLDIFWQVLGYLLLFSL